MLRLADHARYTARKDGRWQFRVLGPVPGITIGAASTTAVDAMAAILHAAGGD